MPIHTRPFYVCLQYLPAIQILTLNDRVVVNTGHPSEMLRYSPLNGRDSPDLPFADCLANDKVAATSAVPVRQS
jgi:hypothetical protein